MPIQDVGISDSVNPNIQHSASFAEWEAAHAANLDLFKWVSGEYPRWFMVKVMAWHMLHQLVETHRQDAISKDMKMRQKSAKGK